MCQFYAVLRMRSHPFPQSSMVHFATLSVGMLMLRTCLSFIGPLTTSISLTQRYYWHTAHRCVACTSWTWVGSCTIQCWHWHCMLAIPTVWLTCHVRQWCQHMWTHRCVMDSPKHRSGLVFHNCLAQWKFKSHVSIYSEAVQGSSATVSLRRPWPAVLCGSVVNIECQSENSYQCT